MNIKITEIAAKHVNLCIKYKQNCIGLRIKIEIKGCSGMSYKLEYVEFIDKKDNIFNYFGVKIFISKKILFYLNGIKIDYKKYGTKEGFIFNNPNEKSVCGCGESFII